MQNDIKSSEITCERLYLSRRKFITSGALALAGIASPSLLGGMFLPPSGFIDDDPIIQPKGKYDTDEKQSSLKEITHYNNYYEFGTDKSDPSENAGGLRIKPWMVQVDGYVRKPATYDIDDLLKPHTMEDRIYRMRCVEGWSMVIPWLGFPLRDLITRLEPGSKAKYVEFTTLYDPDQMPGQKRGVLEWPYVEGLRIDEAMHPLTILAVGLYGKRPLPNQNGAPLRLVVPWKYGFKGIKSIVKIRFTDSQPVTSWSQSAPNEYGFYSNVNPDVDHPRWSQKTERRLGEFFKRKTLPFNGYGDQVANLYTGMDLRKYF